MEALGDAPASPAAAGGLDDALRAIDGVEGWLSPDQAEWLWRHARGVRAGGRIVEIGSYRGRSTILLATAAAAGVEIVAIDPHAGNDRGPQQIEGSASEGEADHRAFLANLSSAGVAGRVRHVRLPSADARGAWSGEIDLLYVDGAHRYRPARDDIRDWGERVRPGGTMLVHDAFSSIGVTLALMRLVLMGRRFRYAGRTRSLAAYTRAELPGGERVRNALRQSAELPWFARNLVVKVALATGLSALARIVGYRSREWPY
ncbi:MAG: class I SAM-dependent methyltransferase [Actinobacteria bacterium]|nr:class I SAM-dependent methyltransferase [Actinomycetota bacterium]